MFVRFFLFFNIQILFLLLLVLFVFFNTHQLLSISLLLSLLLFWYLFLSETGAWDYIRNQKIISRTVLQPMRDSRDEVRIKGQSGQEVVCQVFAARQQPREHRHGNLVVERGMLGNCSVHWDLKHRGDNTSLTSKQSQFTQLEQHSQSSIPVLKHNCCRCSVYFTLPV